MRIALLGAGRIGQLHGRLVAEQPGVDEVIVNDVIAENAAKAAEAVTGPRRGRARVLIPPPPTPCRRRVHKRARPAGLPVHRRRQAGLRREAAGLRPRVDGALVEKAEAAAPSSRSGSSAASTRPTWRRSASSTRASSDPVHGPAHRPRPHAAPRRVHPGLGRPVPRLVDPRLRRAPLAHRLGDRRGLRTGAVRNFPIFAEYDDVDTGAVHLHLRERGDRVARPDPPQPAGLRRAHGGHRLQGRGVVGLDGRTPIRSLEAGAPVTANPAWDCSSTGSRRRTGWSCSSSSASPAVRSEPVHRARRDAGDADRVHAAKSRLEHRPVRLDEVP